MRWSLDDVPIYLAIIDHQGISAAAQALDSSKSTVSKSLARLEQALGVRLIERNSRNLRITQEGEVFYRHAALIMEQVREADAVMAGMTSEPFGKLVVALPMAFAREFIAPQLESFRRRFPQIELELVLSSRPVDLIRDQIDLAVVVGVLNDSELVARPLYEGRLLWVTSPDYAARQRLQGGVEELRSHVHICEKRYGQSQFALREAGVRQTLDLNRGITHVNDPLAVREAVRNGCGVSLLPEQYCRQDLQQGRLLQVYRDIELEASASQLSVVYPGRRGLPNKTRAFIEFLLEICRAI